MKRLGVLGWPVAHSRSPAMQTAALAALGLASEWSYQQLPVPPELLEETTRALAGAGFVGANVTIPHKHAALALADAASHAAREIGAANTLSFAVDGAIAAENTDAPGLIGAMKGDAAGCSPAGRSALVLGAGGSARAAVWALRDAGAREISVWNRTVERAQELARELGARVVPAPEAADILVNCTSVGLAPSGPGARVADTPPGSGASTPDAGTSMADDTATTGQDLLAALNQLGLTLDLVGRYSYVVDLVYRADGPTPLLHAARERGVPALDGLEVLLAQGALSLELWTGRTAPIEVMRRAARAAD